MPHVQGGRDTPADGGEKGVGVHDGPYVLAEGGQDLLGVVGFAEKRVSIQPRARSAARRMASTKMIAPASTAFAADGSLPPGRTACWHVTIAITIATPCNTSTPRRASAYCRPCRTTTRTSMARWTTIT